MKSRPDASDDAIAAIKAALGDKGWSQDPDVLAPLLVDTRDYYHGQAAILARPQSVEEVSEVLSICAKADLAVTPQGGNTSRVGSATPDESGTQVLLSLARMNRVLDIDADDYTMTVEAGCVLKDIQDAAAASDRLFPLSLGAEGSCMIGGNIASNAGGVNVLRYGNTRDLVLGLEVVTADGEIWNGLRRLRKDNTGYDLKHLFIGSEGTLGVITKATLKLFPLPKERATALCALSSLEACLSLLARARAASGDALSSFELMAGITLSFAYKHIDTAKRALEGDHEWQILLEFSGLTANGKMNDAMEALLQDAFEEGLVTDAVIAQSEQQRAELWFLREAIVAAQIMEGPSIKHDVAVPVSRVPEFLTQAGAALEAHLPGVRPYPFGHVGDGNIHYNITAPIGMTDTDFKSHQTRINKIVHDITHGLDGSISAEHGIGQLKRDELPVYKSALELDLMKRVKTIFDPAYRMNPGKIFQP